MDAAVPADAGPHDAGGEESPAPAKRARFHCFAWAQAPQTTMTDCFRFQLGCEYALEKLDAGAANPTCEPADQAWCTEVGRNLIKASEEHCFSSPAHCDQYVSDMRSDHEVATNCDPR